MTEATEAVMNKYHVHVTSSDSLGMNMIENVIKLANMGAVLKPGTLPMMRFPHSCSMVLEAHEPPFTSATVRVFELESCQEIKNPYVAPEAPVVTGATFSMDEDTSSNKDTGEGGETAKVYTREELLAMDFETEFRDACKAVGVVGRGRDKMIKEYLEKVA